MSGETLPVADAAQVGSYLRDLVRRHPRVLLTMVGLHASAAAAGLVAPRLLGDIVESVQSGVGTGHVDRLAAVVALALVAQTLLTRWARLRSTIFGEEVLAELREDFVDHSLALPIGVVESAGSGDLLTRTSRDVEQLGWSVRWALPEWVIAVVTALLTMVAALLVGAWVLLPVLVGVPGVVVGTRWYLRRAKDGYLAENASYSQINASLTETVEGARTVEALDLGTSRIRQVDADIAGSYLAERYTLFLRTCFFPSVEVTSYLLPSVVTLLFGGWLYTRGEVSLGDVTAATLYVQMLIDPVDRVVGILDELQVGAASLARLLGVAHVPDDRVATGRAPQGEELDVEDVRFSYVEGRDVLHGVDLTVRPGERLAMVGPSGAGKSTLGRLLAGIHPPRTGSVDVGGVGLTELPLAELRGHVALVTQEHHVFVGTVARQPRARRGPGRGRAGARGGVWTPWTRSAGCEGCRTGSTPWSAPAAARSTRPRPSSWPWPAWYWPIRTPWSSTRRPRSSTPGPPGTWSAPWPRSSRAGRSSRSPTGCSRPTTPTGSRWWRTAGSASSGSHEELVARDGSYAALWRSWQS